MSKAEQKIGFTDAVFKALGLKGDGEFTTTEETFTALKRFKQIKDALESYEKSVLKPNVFRVAEEQGIVDEKGSATVVFPDGTGFRKEARQSVKVNTEKAIALFQEQQLDEFIDYSVAVREEADLSVLKELVPIGLQDKFFMEKAEITDNSIEQAYLNGKINDDHLQEIIDKKVIFAMTEVKPKK